MELTILKHGTATLQLLFQELILSEESLMMSLLFI
jgi:hypothetical protein